MSACPDHREFLAAIADGETALVPAATLEHVKSCADCTREIGAHQVLSSMLSRPDPVQAAVNASSQPLQIESNDPSQVGHWCLQASGRTVPAIQLDGMQVVGARMDRAASTDIVTVVYSAPSGDRITVSWLEGQAPSGAGVEDRNMSGRQLLIVHSAVGTAVITGSSADAMWQTAAAIEATPRRSAPEQLIDQLA